MTLLARTLGCLSMTCALSCSATSPAAAGHPAHGPMPPGASWQGVYQGPYHILLSLWMNGDRASGTWRAVGNREGAFVGTVHGNLLVMNWNERARSGPETWSGRGYFVYRAGEHGSPDQIFGEWGVGQKGAMSPWWALKRSNEPVRSSSGRIDADTDQRYQDDATSCDLGACDNDQGL